MLTKKFLSHFSVIMTGAFVGLIGIFVRYIGDSMHPLVIAFFRLLIGFLFLLLFVPFIDRTIFKVKWVDLKHYIAIGGLFASGMSCYVFALLHSPISTVVLIEKTYVIFVTIFALIFLHEKITRKEIIAMLIGLVGIALINPFEKSYFIGNLFAFLTAIIFGFQIVYTKYEERTHSAGIVMWFLFFATLFLLPAPFIIGFGAVKQNLLWLIILGVLCTGLAYFLLNYGLKKMEAEHSSLLMMISSPLVAIISAVIFLGEIPSLKVIIGGAILLASGVILETGKNKK